MTKRKNDDFIKSLEWDLDIPQPAPTGMKGVETISDAEFERIRHKELAFGDAERGVR